MIMEGDGKMAVALLNLFIDSIDDAEIKLDRPYQNIRFLNCSGRLEGDTVYLDQPVYGYTVAAFEVW